VDISAQNVGVTYSKQWDPVRYSSLSHPGDSYAHDMFAQGIQALRTPVGIDPLGGIGAVQRIIAIGHSQSGSQLHSYLTTGFQNNTNLVDAFLIRGDGNLTYDVANLHTPVIVWRSDLEFTTANIPSSQYLRLWDLPSSPHGSTMDFNDYMADDIAHDNTGVNSYNPQAAGNYGQELVGGPTSATPPPNQAQEEAGCSAGGENPVHYAMREAVLQLDQWVRTGTPAIQPPVVAYDTSGSLIHDQYGNVAGGLRLPPLVVPADTYSNVCGFPGSTIPFDSATLASLYPTHQGYVDQMYAAAQQAVASQYMQAVDVPDLMTRACASAIGAGSATCPGLSPQSEIPEAPAAPLLLLLPAMAGLTLVLRKRRQIGDPA
jgi:hypothetical protein